jgi:hypothetical protein
MGRLNRAQDFFLKEITLFSMLSSGKTQALLPACHNVAYHRKEHTSRVIISYDNRFGSFQRGLSGEMSKMFLISTQKAAIHRPSADWVTLCYKSKLAL